MCVVSQPELVLAQCRSGIVGAFPLLDARADGVVAEWRQRLPSKRTGNDPLFAVNLVVHRRNVRLETDLILCVNYKKPIIDLLGGWARGSECRDPFPWRAGGL